MALWKSLDISLKHFLGILCNYFFFFIRQHLLLLLPSEPVNSYKRLFAYTHKHTHTAVELAMDGALLQCPSRLKKTFLLPERILVETHCQTFYSDLAILLVFFKGFFFWLLNF